MRDWSSLATALKVARVSTPALTNFRTATTSLVAVPLLEVVLLVAIVATLGSTDLLVAAYAAIVVSFGIAIVTGTVAIVTRDRQTGVLVEALQYRPLNPVYWASKVAIPVATGAVVAIASCTAVWTIDPTHAGRPLVAALMALAVTAAGASLAAIGVATISIGLSDPYLVANIAQGLLPLTAGVVAPLAAYPPVLAALSRAMPTTASIEGLRAMVGGDGAQVAVFVAQELVVCSVWLAIGAAASSFVLRALRSGKRREDIW